MLIDLAADRKAASSLRILLVTEASGGGVGRHLADLARGLLANGHEVHLVYSSRRADTRFLAELEELPGLRQTALNMRRSPHLSDLRALVLLRRYLRRHGPFDIVHSHSSKAGVLARIAPLGMRTTQIYTPHALKTMDPDLPWPLRRLYGLVERVLARSFSARVIAVSEAERRHALHCGLPSEKLVTIPNGIAGAALAVGQDDAQKMRAAARTDGLTLGFVGRLAPQKRPEWAIHALAALRPRHPGLRLLMVASGPLYDDAIRLAQKLGVGGDIDWRPDLPGHQAMAEMDLLLVPSLFESFPYVILEAMAEGLPLVVPDCAAPPELTDAPSPLRLAPDDLEGFIATVDHLIAEPETRATLGRTGRVRVGDYSVGRMVAQTLETYKRGLYGADEPVAPHPYRTRPNVEANL